MGFQGTKWHKYLQIHCAKRDTIRYVLTMKRVTALILSSLVAVTVLSACSAKGAGTDFCDVSQKFANDDIQFAELSDADVQNAIGGDMSGVNEWGTSTVAMVSELSDEIERAKGGAPSDEAVKALEDVADGFSLLESMASAAAEADDFGAFATQMDAVSQDLATFNTTMADASDVLDKAETEYCR